MKIEHINKEITAEIKKIRIFIHLPNKRDIAPR